MKKHLPSTIVIDSQSDIDSSSSNQPMQIESSIPKAPQLENMYARFTESKYYLLTDSLKKYANMINQFLEERKNILFLFGPSGCGKSMLVKKILAQSNIKHDIVQEHEAEQDETYVSLGDSILQCLRSMSPNLVHICYDFPTVVEKQKWNTQEVRKFKLEFSKCIKSTSTKVIFILNNEIYNSFYLLNQRGLGQQNLNARQNVSVIKMEKFGVLEMKKILKGFLEHEKLFSFVSILKNTLDEIVDLSNGDLRKALYLIYWKGIQQKSEEILKQEKKKVANSKRIQFQKPQINQKLSDLSIYSPTLIEVENTNSQQIKRSIYNSLSERKQNDDSNQMTSISMFSHKSSDPKMSRKKPLRPDNYETLMKNVSSEETRFSFYGGLGKLLYGKRLNIMTTIKNKKDISCYYKQHQIKQLDPPFYFDPCGLFYQLKVDLQVVTKMLQQNHLERYGTIRDVRDMSKIFTMYDGFFSFRNNVEDEEVKQIKVKLIMWGILIYNRNSRTDNFRFRQFERSQIANVMVKVKEKKRLVRRYYQQIMLPTWVHYPMSDLSNWMKFAQITRNLQTPYMLKDIIFDRNLSKQYSIKIDDNTKMINEDQAEEELQQAIKMGINEIQVKLKKSLQQKKKKEKELAQLLMEMDQEEVEDPLSDSSDDQLMEMIMNKKKVKTEKK